MNGRLVRIAALLLVAVAIVAAAYPAGAGTTSSAVYYPLSDNQGILRVTADQGSSIVVRGEQPDGSYAIVAKCGIGSDGTCDIAVPHVGPTTNGQPQYLVSIRPASSVWYTIVATGPIEEEWWLD